MDTVTLVDSQIDDGQVLLDRLGDEGFVVRVACWLKPVDPDRWSLYIASPVVDEKGKFEGYRKVGGVMRSLGEIGITSSDVYLVGEKHPLVRDVLAILRRFPDGKPPRSQGFLLGGIPVEDLYVYPPGKVEVTIYGMIFRGQPDGGLHLSFEPHNPHSWLEEEIKGKRNVYPAEVMDWVVAAPEGSVLERNDAGRMVLAWNLRGKRTESGPIEIWTFAKLGQHGFRFLRERSGKEVRG